MVFFLFFFQRLSFFLQTQRLPSTQPSLSRYTESDGGLEYYRGTCDTFLSMNTTEGSYNFTVEILPGHGPVFAGSAVVGQLFYVRLHLIVSPVA